jgi:uncharacterized protein YndB with AHSA1/START domain
MCSEGNTGKIAMVSVNSNRPEKYFRSKVVAAQHKSTQGLFKLSCSCKEGGFPMNTFQTSLDIPASPAAVFAAFEDPARLARWWGPDGFRNSFRTCEFRPGGTWQFTMHGPHGAIYNNESVFSEIERDRKIVIDHASHPRFRLSVSLYPSMDSTLVVWTQVFDDPTLAASVRHVVEPANEQNLRRLAAEVVVQ